MVVLPEVASVVVAEETGSQYFAETINPTLLLTFHPKSLKTLIKISTNRSSKNY